MNVLKRHTSILMLFLAVAFVGCSSDKSADKNDPAKSSARNTDGKDKGRKVAKRGKTIRIGWVYAMANAPVLIADKKGYFKELGVNVELVRFTSGPRIKQGLKSGRLDLAFIGAPPVYHWYSKGLKGKIIAKVNYGQASVLVHADSGIENIAGLKNKRLAGVRIGSGMDVLLRGYVLEEKALFDLTKDIEVSPMKPVKMGDAIENKEVQGAFTWEPFTSKYLLRGNTKLIMDLNKELPNYPWYVVMAMPKSLEAKRPEIVKVLQAHRKAIAYLNSSPDAGNKIIAKAFNLRDVIDKTGKRHSPEKILEMARTRLGWQAELTDYDKAFVQRLMDYSHKLGYMSKKLKASDLIDQSLLKESKTN